MKIALVICYLILTMSGLVFMKLGGNTGTFSFGNSEVSFAISPVSLFGFICYIGSFLLFTKMVVMFDLSYILPLCTGITQVLTLIFSKVIFKENISIQGLIGACVIILGIIVMNWKVVK